MYAIFFHGHQKLDRVARRHLSTLLGEQNDHFPSAAEILRFEGRRGPDATRLKKQAGDQPWHFINPMNEDDRTLVGLVEDHYRQLVVALRDGHRQRASFEAAWLAHAMVDGLTPAHHYPFGEVLEEIQGHPPEERKGFSGRLFARGDTALQTVLRTMKIIGPHGVMTNHATFEGGVYMILAPQRLRRGIPRDIDIKRLEEVGLGEYFLQQAREVAGYAMYARFLRRGWTQDLMRDVRLHLGPRLVRLITLAWHAAYVESQQPVKTPRKRSVKKTKKGQE